MLGMDITSVTMGIYLKNGEGYGRISFIIKDDIDMSIFNKMIQYVESKGYKVDPTQVNNEFEAESGKYFYPRIKFSFDPNSFDNVEEVTSATSSGSYTGGLKMGQRYESNLPEELDEVTTTTSVGGDSGTFAYDAPLGDGSDFWTKGNKQRKELKESAEKRYVAQVSFYVWSDSDEKAKEEANLIAKLIDDKYDNRASLEGLSIQNFGNLGSKKIELNETDSDSEDYLRYLNMYKNADAYERREIKDRLLKAAKKIGIKLNLDEDAYKNAQYPGGKFVEFDDCVKLNNNDEAKNGGCNQGDFGVVNTKDSVDKIK